MDGLLEADILDLDCPRERALLERAVLQADMVAFQPIPEVQIVCSRLGEVQDQTKNSLLWICERKDKDRFNYVCALKQYKILEVGGGWVE